MSNGNQLPVLQGYWRLLEKGEEILPTDFSYEQGAQCHQDDWAITLHAGSFFDPEFHRPIRRRVSPPPTCGTCEYFDPELKYFSDICGHGEGLHSCNPNGSDYCSKHPQAQEVTR